MRRRPGWLLRLVARSATEPEVCGHLHWPIDVVAATATVKPPLRARRPVRLDLARDAVTGRRGVVDLPLTATESVPAGVVPAAVDAVGRADPAELREYARNQLVWMFRPTEIRELQLGARRRVHIPYHVVRCGSETWLVDRLTGRLETGHQPAVRAAVRHLPR